MAGVSNSKGLAGRMRLKVRSYRPHESKKIDSCVNKSIYLEKINKITHCFL